MLSTNNALVFFFFVSTVYFMFNSNPCHAWSMMTASSSTTKLLATKHFFHHIKSIAWEQQQRCFKLKLAQDDENDNERQANTNTNEQKIKIQKSDKNYEAPKFSKSFMQYMEKVRAEGMGRGNKNKEGVDCTGEPSIDPSRLIQDDVLDSEYLSDFDVE